MNVMAAHQFSGMTDFILGTLDGPDHGLLAPRYQQQQSLARPAEGRHQLRPVLDSEATRRARPGIDQAALLSQPLLDPECGLPDFRQSRPHRCDGRELAADHRLQHIRWLPEVDVGVARAWAFGVHWRAPA